MATGISSGGGGCCGFGKNSTHPSEITVTSISPLPPPPLPPGCTRLPMCIPLSCQDNLLPLSWVDSAHFRVATPATPGYHANHRTFFSTTLNRWVETVSGRQ